MKLRAAIGRWLERRFNLQGVDPERQVLPVNGTREALFSFTQAAVDPADRPLVLMPNPFYQIYEGAALLAGAEPWYLPTGPRITSYNVCYTKLLRISSCGMSAGDTTCGLDAATCMATSRARSWSPPFSATRTAMRLLPWT